MGFHHDIDEVGDGSNYIQLDFSYDLRPGSYFQVFTIDYISTVSLWILLIFGFLHCEMEGIFEDLAETAHQRNLDGTKATDLQLYISISDINFNQELEIFPVLEEAVCPAGTLTSVVNISGQND